MGLAAAIPRSERALMGLGAFCSLIRGSWAEDSWLTGPVSPEDSNVPVATSSSKPTGDCDIEAPPLRVTAAGWTRGRWTRGQPARRRPSRGPWGLSDSGLQP
jgi:hypothetical protein